MKRYPQYRQSGIDWLGEVPSHWKTVRAKFLVSVSGGNTPSKEVPENWGGTIPWVSPKDMKSMEIRNSEDHLTEQGLEASTSGLLPEGSLLMVVRSGILQHTIPIAITRTKVTVNQDIRVIRPTASIQPDYLLRQIQGLQKPFLAEWVKQGATVESVEQKYFAETPMVVPPQEEQADIAAYLDGQMREVDALIAEKEGLLKVLDEYRRSVVTTVVTQGLNVDVVFKPSSISWLPEIPEHWQTIAIKRLLSSMLYGTSESSNEEGSIRILTMGNISDGEVSTEVSGYLDDLPEELILEKHDLLFNRTNSAELVGKVGIFRGEKTDKVSFASYLVRMRVKKPHNPEWLNYVVNCDAFLAFARSHALISLNQANLNSTRYGHFDIPVPPVDEQRDIAEYLDRRTREIDELRAHVVEHIKLLREYKSALISEAVTGQIDVRGYAATSSEASFEGQAA